MRAWCLALSCAALAGLLAGCSGLGMIEPPPRLVSEPPTEIALAKNVTHVATTVKWTGMPEASPVRQAHLLAPADWIVCVQSSARDLSPVYAVFFNGDKMIHFRIAVEIDQCGRMPYALVAPLPVEEPVVKRDAGRRY
jgi:hypothetical protein